MTLQKSWSCLVIAAAAWLSHTSASRSDDQTWIPTPADIQDLEQNLTSGPAQPTYSQPPFTRLTTTDLKISARYYYGGFHDGVKVIKGEIVKGEGGKRGISIQAEMPLIMDGGCSVINLLYDPKRHRFIWFECNGLA